MMTLYIVGEQIANLEVYPYLILTLLMNKVNVDFITGHEVDFITGHITEHGMNLYMQ